MLIPDKEGEIKNHSGFGVLLTTIISFFLAEMGDKTQLATVALGATYSDGAMVTIGTTLGMIASNALVIFLGDRLLRKISMKWVRIISAVLFILFAVLVHFTY